LISDLYFTRGIISLRVRVARTQSLSRQQRERGANGLTKEKLL